MGDQYEDFNATDGQNITCIQYIHPNDGETEQINFIIPSNSHILKQEDDSEILEETYEEYIDVAEDDNGMGVEVLESVVNIGKKGFPIKTESLTKELVQISDSNKPKGRKRLIADQTRAIRKLRTNRPYINAKGREATPKSFDEVFVCTCPKKCTDPKKLSPKIRKQIFNMFWSIGSYEGRCAFLNSCVNEAPKKALLKGVEVCKLTFTKTLQISNSRIDVSLAKMESESFMDERGKKKRRKHGFGEDTQNAVIEHIKNNFNSETSLRGLWNNYQATHEEIPVSESYYKRIFYENFNLKDTLQGIEAKSYNRRERSDRSRSRERRRRRERSNSRSYRRSRSREHRDHRDRGRDDRYYGENYHSSRDTRERSRSRDRGNTETHYRGGEESTSRSRPRKSPEPTNDSNSETFKRSYEDRNREDRYRERDTRNRH